MSFQDLFRTWRGKGILDETIDEFVQMIEHTHWMFGTAVEVLRKESGDGGKIQKIRDRDILVNKIERSIRKKIVQHLAVAPGTDVPYCLVVFSVVKDAERLGDYCKNISEVVENHTPYDDDNEVISELRRIESEVEQMFGKTGRTFRDSDEDLAREIIDRELDIAKRCDKLHVDVSKVEGLSNAQAVSYVLLARYYKRVSAHLGNIASSVVMPIHKLDYYDEKYLEPEKEEDT